MNCYKHPNRVAVATCSQGCGRSLCKECSEKYDPPTCNLCAARIKTLHNDRIVKARSSIVKKIIVNILFLIPYIVIILNQNNNASFLLLIPILIWGFIGFSWLLNAILDVTRFIIFDSIKGWSFTYIVGSLIVGIFGFIVIPVLIILQLIQLNRISK